MKKSLADYLGDYGHDTNLRKNYEQDLLVQNRRFVTVITVFSGVMQLLLMIPDYLFISDQAAKTTILVLRAAVCLLSFLFAWVWLRIKIRTYAMYCRLMTGLEVLIVLLFLYVFYRYDPPEFIIQSMGLMIIIMVVFIIPNRFSIRLALSVGSFAAYQLLVRLILRDRLPINTYLAGTSYLLIVLVICIIFSRILDRHQFLEYKAKDQLVHLNMIDPLTGAYNRNKLIEAWQQWFAWSQRYAQPLTLVMLDVDSFKQINDEHGHSAADVVLIELVDLIQTQLRTTDLLARWGGDEFVILLPNTTADEAMKVLTRIRRILSQKPLAGCIAVHCSFGVAAVQSVSTLDTVIRQADSLMYQSKKAGGDQVCREIITSQA